jgi:hypothetical protein
MADPSVSSIAIYQLRVLLCGVSPLVWRRLLVISETSLAELHEILRTAFDWSGEHLHRFLIYGAAYGVPCLGGMFFREDARRVPLSRFRLHCGCWPKIVRCGDDLQDSSGDPRRKRPPSECPALQ